MFLNKKALWLLNEHNMIDSDKKRTANIFVSTQACDHFESRLCIGVKHSAKLVLRTRFVTSMQRVTLFISNVILELNHSGKSRDEDGAPNHEKEARASMGGSCGGLVDRYLRSSVSLRGYCS